MIGGMVETRIAMGFVVPGAFVVEVCKPFSYIVIRMLQPTNWKKYHFVWHLYMFSAAILFLRFMDAFLLVWSHPFYCPKIQCMAATKVVLLSLYVFTSSFKDSSHWQTKIAVTFY